MDIVDRLRSMGGFLDDTNEVALGTIADEIDTLRARVKELELNRQAIIKDFVSGLEPFGYFKAEPFGWTDCVSDDDGAIPLFDISEWIDK